jgi:Arc/MetJ family transcription regulator
MIWLTHMKTTIEISDGLLQRAKLLAAQRNTTLRELVEQALRETLEREAAPARARPVETHTFRGNGLQPGVSWDDWGAIRDLAYEGRGA